MTRSAPALTGLLLGLAACGAPASDTSNVDARLRQYATVRLTADLGALAPEERRLIALLLDAADEMDAIFWRQAYGNRDSLLGSLTDPATRRFAEINYGPWDRLDNDTPFLPGIGAKPAGARFYPADLTAEEFRAYVEAHPEQAAALTSLYTLVRRGADGLVTVPYREAFAEPTARAAARLREASALARDPGLRRYLELRAEALLTDEYQASDLAWMDMKTNLIDVVIGPIETYEDQLLGLKASHEAYILLKDREWSTRLARYATFLPALQRGLPVPEPYRRERPGSNAELNAYDVLYYAGEGNAGSKTIAINLPNDEQVQLAKGTRRLQLKNAMRAKFDSILVPLAERLIAEDQRSHITFDAFFANTMFHEVAHGLGIKNTITGRGTVRAALSEHASPLEEGKADVLGLHMITVLRDRGEIPEGTLEDNYVTFLAGIIRSTRFGPSGAHGKANMVTFSFFQEQGAFTRDSVTGTYRVHMERMQAAVRDLAGLILTIQGDGDHARAGTLLATRGVVGPVLQGDLDRLATAGIPVDIVFEQGRAVLGLDP